MPRGFDPKDTSIANIKNEKMNLKALADNWYGSKTKIIDVFSNNGGSSYTVAGTDIGFLVTTGLSYADDADRRGLIIQNSIGNTYHDEIAIASITVGKHKVILVDSTTGNEFLNANGNPVYGVLQDAADHSGTGEATDVFVKFVEDIAGVPTLYTWQAGDETSVNIYMPQRKCRIELEEYDDRTIKVASIVGDAELTQALDDIRSILGILPGEDAGDLDLTNTGNFFPFSELTLGTATLEDVVNKLNEEIGDRDYSQENFVTDGETITESIEALDLALAQAGVKSKILERPSVDIAKGVAHTIPFAGGSAPAIVTYKQDTGHRALFMEVYVAGKKLVPDSSAVATDGDYEETSTTQVTFRFKVKAFQIVEYLIKDDV